MVSRILHKVRSLITDVVTVILLIIFFLFFWHRLKGNLTDELDEGWRCR